MFLQHSEDDDFCTRVKQIGLVFFIAQRQIKSRVKGKGRQQPGKGIMKGYSSREVVIAACPLCSKAAFDHIFF